MSSRKPFCVVSYLPCPINIVEHRHEDDSSFKLFWIFSNVQIFLDLSQNLQVVSPGKIFHSNSIGSPSNPNNSLKALVCWKPSVDFSMSHSLLNDQTSFPEIKLNLSRRILLPSPT